MTKEQHMTENTVHHGSDQFIWTAWISAGRNRTNPAPVDAVAGLPTPLDAGDWHQFQDEIRFTAALWGRHTGVEVHGTSTWEGVPEETFLLLVTFEPEHLTQIRGSLARLAARYDQDSIGFIAQTGPSVILAQVVPA